MNHEDTRNTKNTKNTKREYLICLFPSFVFFVSSWFTPPRLAPGAKPTAGEGEGRQRDVRD